MDYHTGEPLISRLFPTPDSTVALHGLYLAHQLHKLRSADNAPFVYSNFISSLDGRIAIESEQRETSTVPESIANPRDWRLYQELAAQAEILITSGRFYRQSEAGEAQDQLPVGNQAEFDDLRAWRVSQGLPAQPDIVILSSSLDIPLSALEPYRSRRIMVATGANADAERKCALLDNGIEILEAGRSSHVDGKLLVNRLGTLGYRSLYAIAGPAVLHTLVQAGALDRLYLTLACRLLGGEGYDTLVRGRSLNPPAGMQLHELHHDPAAPEGAGQLFCVFDRKS